MPDKFCSTCGTAFKIADQAFCSMCGAPSGNSEEIIMEDFEPFAFEFNRQEFSDFSEGVFTHHNANLVIVGSTSERWFPGNNFAATELASKCSRDLPEYAQDYQINELFLDGDEFFEDYESILWKDSIFGARFIRILEERGAAVTHGYFGRTVQVDLPDGTMEQIPLSKPIDLYTGRWGLSDGTEFAQIGQVFKSKKDSSEIVYWHFDALANTRYSLFSRESDLSSKVSIPRYLQVAAYLAETPFPSALAGSMGLNLRNGLFGPGDENLPRPVIRHQRDGISIGLVKNSQGVQAISFWAPELYQFGYAFAEKMSDQEIYDALPAICDGIPKIAEIIVDGFAHWLPGSDLDFQACLMSDFTLGDEYAIYEAGALVPGVLYGHLCQRSIAAYDQTYPVLHKALTDRDFETFKSSMSVLETLFEFGIGSISSHAVNTFASQALEANLDIDLDSVLEYFSEIDVDSQGVNALSNLILSKIKQEKLDDAYALLKKALEKCKAPGPNLDTLSYFNTWDGSTEEPIFLEIFESALLVMSKLGKKEELRSLAKQIQKYCEKRSIEPSVLLSVQEYL